MHSLVGMGKGSVRALCIKICTVVDVDVDVTWFLGDGREKWDSLPLLYLSNSLYRRTFGLRVVLTGLDHAKSDVLGKCTYPRPPKGFHRYTFKPKSHQTY